MIISNYLLIWLGFNLKSLPLEYPPAYPCQSTNAVYLNLIANLYGFLFTLHIASDLV